MKYFVKYDIHVTGKLSTKQQNIVLESLRTIERRLVDRMGQARAQGWMTQYLGGTTFYYGQ